MRLLSGLSLLALAFFLSHRLADAGAGGYYNMPALVLIILCPIAVAIISHDPKELWRDVRLALRSLRDSETMQKRQLGEDFSALSSAQRQQQRLSRRRARQSTRCGCETRLMPYVCPIQRSFAQRCRRRH